MPASPTDEDLLSAALAGDERAFGELYRRWQGPMFRFARQMCGADGAAFDVGKRHAVQIAARDLAGDLARGGGRGDEGPAALKPPRAAA